MCCDALCCDTVWCELHCVMLGCVCCVVAVFFVAVQCGMVSSVVLSSPVQQCLVLIELYCIVLYYILCLASSYPAISTASVGRWPYSNVTTGVLQSGSWTCLFRRWSTYHQHQSKHMITTWCCTEYIAHTISRILRKILRHCCHWNWGWMLGGRGGGGGRGVISHYAVEGKIGGNVEHIQKWQPNLFITLRTSAISCVFKGTWHWLVGCQKRGIEMKPCCETNRRRLTQSCDRRSASNSSPSIVWLWSTSKVSKAYHIRITFTLLIRTSA